MRNNTIVCLLLTALLGWQAQAQVLDQNANWPNTSWTLTGSFSLIGLASNPTVSANFSYEDNGNVNFIAAESPVIDLTAAANAGETWINITTEYSYNESNEMLELQYYDTAISTWVPWPGGILPDNATYNTWACGNNTTSFVTNILDIGGFTTAQLSGFKYRISYDDLGNYVYGFCMSSPTITSTAPPSCFPPTGLSAAYFTDTSVELSWTSSANSWVHWWI